MTTTAQVVLDVEAEAGALWRVLADWGGICDWAPPELIATCRVDGDVRHLTTGQGRAVAERLEYADPVAGEVVFSIVGPAPGRIGNYRATVHVERLDEARSRVSWTGRMDVPEGADPARIVAGFEASYRMLIESAAKAARGERPDGPASTDRP